MSNDVCHYQTISESSHLIWNRPSVFVGILRAFQILLLNSWIGLTSSFLSNCFLYTLTSGTVSYYSLTTNSASKLYNKEPISTNLRTEIITDFPGETSRILEGYVEVLCSFKGLWRLNKHSSNKHFLFCSVGHHLHKRCCPDKLT